MFQIPRGILDAVNAHAAERTPEEVCGLFAGRREGGANIVERVYRIRNAHERPIGEYLLDPTELLRATLAIEDDLGLEVVGFYHSHPRGPPRFSQTDMARASWPGVSYFLVWLAPRAGHLSARWSPDSGRLVNEETLVL